MVGEVAAADVSARLQLGERRGDDVGGRVELFDQGVQRPAAATTDGLQQTRGGAVRRRPTLGRRRVVGARKKLRAPRAARHSREARLADKRMAFGVAKAKHAFGVTAELELAASRTRSARSAR